MKYTIRKATIIEIMQWDELVLTNTKNPGMLQSRAFANIKSSFGWKPVHVVYEQQNGEKPTYAFFLEKNVIGFGYLWYLPTESFAASDMADLVAANKVFVKMNRSNVFVIKLDSFIIDSSALHNEFHNLGLIKTQDLQPNTSTVEMSLVADDEEMFASLFRRARRNINIATRQDLDIRQVPVNESTFHIMYELMKTVNGGKGASFIRPLSYYVKFWTEFCMREQGFFYFAFEDNRPVVGAFIIKYGNKATYKDGGSSPERDTHNKYAHAIQWYAMQKMSKIGVTTYDFCGTPPSHLLGDPDHHYHGMGEFKTGFNNTVIDYSGTYDQVIKNSTYKAWSTGGERIVKRIHWSMKHEVYY